MEDKNKKIIASVVAVLLIIVLLIFIFFIFRSDKGGLAVNPGNDDPFGTPPEGGSDSGFGTGTGGIILNTDEALLTGEVFAKLRKVSSVPVSGATIYSENNENTIRFIERSTGHLYETTTQETLVRRISNTTIPKAEEVVWGENGQTLILRYEKDGLIETFSAEVTDENSSEENLVAPTNEPFSLTGSFLPLNILEISKNGNRTAYIRDEFGQAKVYTANIKGENPSLLWQSSVKGWTVKWAGPNNVSITTKSSHSNPGFLYYLGVSNGSLRKIIGDMNGLTTLPSPDGNTILYSRNNNGFFSFHTFNINEDRHNVFPIPSIPDKCTWDSESLMIFCGVPSGGAISGEFPDSWYQGEISFSDSIWSINTETMETKMLADLKSLSQEDIDAIDLKISPDENHLIFTNKRDLTLWVLDISEEQTN